MTSTYAKWCTYSDKMTHMHLLWYCPPNDFLENVPRQIISFMRRPYTLYSQFSANEFKARAKCKRKAQGWL